MSFHLVVGLGIIFCAPPVMMQISITNITFQVVASADLVSKPDS